MMYSVLFTLLFVSIGFVSSYKAPPELHDFDFRPSSLSRHLLDTDAEKQLKLWTALNSLDLKGMKAALDDGADANEERQPSGFRPIHLAASLGNVAAVSLLIDHGAEVDAKTVNGTAALHYASNNGDLFVVKLLLSKHADPNIQDRRKFAPLHYASYAPRNKKASGPQPFVSGGYFDMTKAADVEATEMDAALIEQRTLGKGEYRGVVGLLIAHNADVDIVTNAKETPLHYTPAFDRYLITTDLVEAGANVNMQDKEKETPLHEAVAYGAIGVTQVLLLNGADVSLEEENGLTPAEFICHCRSYKGDSSLTQCSPGKCVEQYDNLVIQKIFDIVGEGN